MDQYTLTEKSKLKKVEKLKSNLLDKVIKNIIQRENKLFFLRSTIYC